MSEILRQYELTRGTTHWIAWLDDDQLKTCLADRWEVFKAYKKPLWRNDDGLLVETKP